VTVAFSTDQAKTAAIILILAVVVVGALISFVVTKLTGRLIVAAVVVAAGIFVWTQRADIESAAKKCDARFLGIHLTPSNKTLKAQCQQAAR
jgi:uncharacterized membrane protein